MGDVLKVIVLCSQDKLDPLGWCVCTKSGQGHSYNVYYDNNSKTLKALFVLKDDLWTSRRATEQFLFVLT